MKLRLVASILIFISSYAPLALIFMIRDYDLNAQKLLHPLVVWPIIGVSIISCIILWASVHFIRTSSPPITIKSASNRSGDLINYSIPYLVTFLATDLGNFKMAASFFVFIVIMFFMTIKTHNIFLNPALALMGYNVYNVRYEINGQEYEDCFLSKGGRLRAGEQCRIVNISEQLMLVTERNPEV